MLRQRWWKKIESEGLNVANGEFSTFRSFSVEISIVATHNPIYEAETSSWVNSGMVGVVVQHRFILIDVCFVLYCINYFTTRPPRIQNHQQGLINIVYTSKYQHLVRNACAKLYTTYGSFFLSYAKHRHMWVRDYSMVYTRSLFKRCPSTPNLVEVLKTCHGQFILYFQENPVNAQTWFERRTAIS